MKRIAITLAALAISTGAYAGSTSPQHQGYVINNQSITDSNVSSKVNTHKSQYFLGANSALGELDAPDRAVTKQDERGVDSEISIGDSLFMNRNDRL
jgi:hypothetical protein